MDHKKFKWGKGRFRAITLIELLVVIAITGILAGIVYLRFEGVARRDQRRDENAELWSFVHAARNYDVQHPASLTGETRDPAAWALNWKQYLTGYVGPKKDLDPASPVLKTKSGSREIWYYITPGDTTEYLRFYAQDRSTGETQYITWNGLEVLEAVPSGGGGCGNSVLDPGEQCDAPDVPCPPASGLSCNTCLCAAICGDGQLEGSEQCDDGNRVGGDGCSAQCKEEFCGDNVRNDGPPGGSGEQCDGSDRGICTLGEICNNCTCQPGPNPQCGDRVKNGSEVCDFVDGCQPPRTCAQDCASCCGNGTKEGTEECDGSDGITPPFETCVSCQIACQPPAPGTLACDDPGTDQPCPCGQHFDNTACGCVANACGDGAWHGTEGEVCDGSAGAVNGCPNQGFECKNDCSGCQPTCSNGNLDPGELCDPGADPNDYWDDYGCPPDQGCSSDCQTCGCPTGYHMSHFHCCPDGDDGVVGTSDDLEWSGAYCTTCGNGYQNPEYSETCGEPGWPTGACSYSCWQCTNIYPVPEDQLNALRDDLDLNELASQWGEPEEQQTFYAQTGVMYQVPGCHWATCSGTCSDCRCQSYPPVCGNWFREGNEECDDGNFTNGDGCTSACRWETCGDGIKNLSSNGPEACDTAATGLPHGCAPGSTCLPDCSACETCATDADCSDGDVCNGFEICDPATFTCQPPAAPAPDFVTPCTTDGNVCTDDVCIGGVCVHQDNTVSCNDNLFCTATDACSGGGCLGSGNACPDDALYCNGTESCDEINDTCPHQYTGSNFPPDNPCPSINPLKPVCQEHSNPALRCVQCLSDANCAGGGATGDSNAIFCRLSGPPAQLNLCKQCRNDNNDCAWLQPSCSGATPNAACNSATWTCSCVA